MPGSVDFLIAGGGPAGSTAAALLASQGRDVVLVERTLEPHHKVCGEFLSYEALRYLRSLGVDPLGLGAVPIYRMRLVANNVIAEMDLPFEAMSLSRKSMDAALLARAEECGAGLIRGFQVEHLKSSNTHWTVVLNDGRELLSNQVMLATGKHNLRGHIRKEAAQCSLIAFKMHMQLSLAQAHKLLGVVEVVLFPGGYLGLQPIGSGCANLCLLIHDKALRRIGGGWAGVLRHLIVSSPFLRERLHGAQELWPRPLALSKIPYGYLRRRTQNGLWALGDQAAVIPSFSGDGMAIALHSAYFAAALQATGADAVEYTTRLYNQLRPQVQRAALLSRAMVRAPQCASLLKYFPSLLRWLAQSTRISSDLLVSEIFTQRSYV